MAQVIRKNYDLLVDGTFGLSAIETLVDEVETDLQTVDGNVDLLLTRLTAARAGYIDELDFDLDARLGSPAGASISADLLTIDGVVDTTKNVLVAAEGTADSGTTTTIVDAARTETDDYWNDMLVVITAGTNAGQARRISDFDAATDTITVDTAFKSAIDGTSVYAIILDRQAAGGGGEKKHATAANQTSIMGTGFDTTTDSLVKISDVLVAVRGTADSGSTTTLVDDALTEGDDYWNDMLTSVSIG